MPGHEPPEDHQGPLETAAGRISPLAPVSAAAEFAGMPPVNPRESHLSIPGGWQGLLGLAADVRHYGRWVRDQVARRIGHLYPSVKLPPEDGGGEATVAAWIWARAENTASADTPLAAVLEGDGAEYVQMDGDQVGAASTLASLWLAESGGPDAARAAARKWLAEPEARQLTPRQLAALIAMSEAVARLKSHVMHDMIDHYSTGSSSQHAVVERDVELYAATVVECLTPLVGACAARWSNSAVGQPRAATDSRLLEEVNLLGSAPGSWEACLADLVRTIR